jgi:hypothetical protein
MATSAVTLEEFLEPLHIEIPKIHLLAKRFRDTFESLAAHSEDQFLPTPISDSILRPQRDDKGR